MGIKKVSALTGALSRVDTDLALKHTTGEKLEFISGGVKHRISTVGG